MTKRKSHKIPYPKAPKGSHDSSNDFGYSQLTWLTKKIGQDLETINIVNKWITTFRARGSAE